MSMLDERILCAINKIDEELADIRGLAQIGPLLDTAGSDYHSHCVLLLSLIDRAAQAATHASERLVHRLQEVR